MIYQMILRQTGKYFLLLFLFLSGIACYSQEYKPTWESLDKHETPAWFSNAKFGIFVHWGVYSVPAYRPIGKERYASYAEWYEAEVMATKGEGRDFHDRVFGKNFEYRDFAPRFTAELFDAKSWAKLFKRAGARYVVLTTKHHDGFCLWPTKTTNWNSMKTGPKRDLVGEISKAVRDEGLKFGAYYSLLEWAVTPTTRNKSGYYLDKKYVKKYGMPHQKYLDERMIPQLKELVVNYSPSLIFADGTWDGDSQFWKSKEFLAWYYNNAPNKEEVEVNDRWGKDTFKKHGDYFTSEYSENDTELSAKHAWEENQGVGGSFGYNRAENIDDYKSSKELVHLLVKVVGSGGNLLLNVGPAADGTIPVIMQQRLADIGTWLAVNGEAIYDTKVWSNSPLNKTNGKFFYTSKGNDLYVICTGWPTSNFKVSGIDNIEKVALLGSNIEVISNYSAGVLTITPPAINMANNPCEYAWVFKISK